MRPVPGKKKTQPRPQDNGLESARRRGVPERSEYQGGNERAARYTHPLFIQDEYSQLKNIIIYQQSETKMLSKDK